MPEKPNGKLTYTDRCYIEDAIAVDRTIREIADHLHVAVSTVSKEIKRNSTPESTRYIYQRIKNICTKKRECQVRDICHKSCLQFCTKCKEGLCNQICPDFEAARCPKLNKPPYVCNGCPGRFGFGCDYGYRFYDAKLANDLAEERKSSSRRGIDCTKKELERAEMLVKPLLDKNQSLQHIWNTHGDELPMSMRTFYRYINEGYVNITNLDLNKKVKYKPRKHDEPKAPRKDMKGRNYEDFEKLPLELQFSAVEMDCVEGRKREKPAILTLLFRRYSFQLMILLPEKTQKEVEKALNLIEELCDGEFSKHFGIILTDRGSEFLDFDLIEKGADGKQRCKVYYCDPMKSGEKGRCEKNHVELRKIFPKGSSILGITEAHVALMCSHVNSYTRLSLGGKAPYTLASQVLPMSLIEALGIEFIPPDDVVLKPSLIGLKG